MDTARYKLRINFTDILLGSAPLNAELYTDYVASKAQPVAIPRQEGIANLNGNAAAEVETIQDADVKGRTGFHRDEAGTPYLYNYTIKGFFKEAWRTVRQQRNRLSSGLTAGISKIDTQIFVSPRLLELHVIRPSEVGVYERPLKAQTAQGPRVALAASEMLPAGTWLECEIDVLIPHIITEPLLREWLDYGRYLGIGQWRSGGYGTFNYTLKPLA